MEMQFLPRLEDKILKEKSPVMNIYFSILFIWIFMEFFWAFFDPSWENRFEEIFHAPLFLFGVITLYGVKRLLVEIKRKSEAIHSVSLSNIKLKDKNRVLSSPENHFWNELKDRFHNSGFTQAELQVAELMLRGFSNKRIAGIRNTSQRTVENQALSIYQKTGTTGKSDFIAYCISSLLPEEELEHEKV